MSETKVKFMTGSLAGHIITTSLTLGIGSVALFIMDVVDMLFIAMLGFEELAAAVGHAGTVRS